MFLPNSTAKLNDCSSTSFTTIVFSSNLSIFQGTIAVILFFQS